MKDKDTCNIINIIDVFYTSFDTTLLLCERLNNCYVVAPSSWKIYKGGAYQIDITLDGISMDGASRFQKITFWSKGHIDKKYFDFNLPMELRK